MVQPRGYIGLLMLLLGVVLSLWLYIKLSPFGTGSSSDKTTRSVGAGAIEDAKALQQAADQQNARFQSELNAK